VGNPIEMSNLLIRGENKNACDTFFLAKFDPKISLLN
jgi:hypothetical protein